MMSASEIIDVVVLKRSSVDERGSQEIAQLIGEKFIIYETYCLDWLDTNLLKRVALIVTYSGDVAEFAADILSMCRMRQQVSWQDNSGLCIIIADRVADTQILFNDFLFFLTEMIGRYCFYKLSDAKTWLPKMFSNVTEVSREVYNFGRATTDLHIFFSASRKHRSGNGSIERILSERTRQIIPVTAHEEVRNESISDEAPRMLVAYAYDDVETVSQLLSICRLRSEGLLRDDDPTVFILGTKVSSDWQSDLLLNVSLRLLSIDVVTTLELALERVLPSVLNDVLGR